MDALPGTLFWLWPVHVVSDAVTKRFCIRDAGMAQELCRQIDDAIRFVWRLLEFPHEPLATRIKHPLISEDQPL